jgi:hypothetical protein
MYVLDKSEHLSPLAILLDIGADRLRTIRLPLRPRLLPRVHRLRDISRRLFATRLLADDN